MPQVMLKIYSWLSQGVEANSASFDEIPISVPEGESVLEMARRLAADDGVFRRAIFDDKNQKIRAHIAVILNGRFVNPYERSEATLKDGDEVTFLPILHGG
ncbi:MAG: MoaD/ThiS family protein [Deltaproteobacteria bacterium]|nr:MoaD/ThiS family protein [Deltaproteobacteria bacterium]MBW2307947.1 MoaD/ThiS family protein [Deltaproteobacteria bacterium]